MAKRIYIPELGVRVPQDYIAYMSQRTHFRGKYNWRKALILEYLFVNSGSTARECFNSWCGSGATLSAIKSKLCQLEYAQYLTSKLNRDMVKVYSLTTKGKRVLYACRELSPLLKYWLPEAKQAYQHSQGIKLLT